MSQKLRAQFSGHRTSRTAVTNFEHAIFLYYGDIHVDIVLYKKKKKLLMLLSIPRTPLRYSEING